MIKYTFYRLRQNDIVIGAEIETGTGCALRNRTAQQHPRYLNPSAAQVYAEYVYRF